MKIALLGDSMIDTLFFTGEFWELKNLLNKNKNFKDVELLNYGVGTTDVELGLYRLTHDYEYKERGRSLPSLVSQNPDIVIVESFAYNHWSKSKNDLERYISIHRKILGTLDKLVSVKVFFLSPIAPNLKFYTRGILALGWSEERRSEECLTTKLYLGQFIDFAHGTGKPVIDCYNASLKNNDGDPQYISNVDFLHNSAFGRKLNADLIYKTILKEDLIYG